ncbi:hypothetical protein [Xanthobacter tagetidis]|uniref:Uncharacterized protein n=1 Tax=Xanthobacter tagetidis TaxID=60216 RepID=A0A3L7AIJ7_9HYPH|nr:hypothetical protein [Xanthobacter tagetidis]MBB6306204.1 hypothetical protein [Xanthobacter tagetidis]RLP79488.1 hypothetical protein D9R14_07435 [Xanthobacter tagetidis]
MKFIVYDLITGEILHGGSAANVERCLGRVTCGQHEVIRFVDANPAEHYVVDDQIVPRPALDLPPVATVSPARCADDLTPLPTVYAPPGDEPVAVLSGLPEGTVVEMRGEPVPVVDGVVSIVPQTTDLHVAPPFPWRSADVRVILEPSE